jgi:hypothetical protein
MSQILNDNGILREIASPDGNFVLPSTNYLMGSLCSDLKPTGCCAYTFQKIAAAFLMAMCRVDEALTLAQLSRRCEDVGVPLLWPCHRHRANVVISLLGILQALICNACRSQTVELAIRQRHINVRTSCCCQSCRLALSHHNMCGILAE